MGFLDRLRGLVGTRDHDAVRPQGFIDRLMQYGMTSDARMVDGLIPMYQAFLAEVALEDRLAVLADIIERVDAKQLHTNVLWPFVTQDDDHGVVSTAALAAAQSAPLKNDDPLTGVRECLRLVDHFTAAEEWRAASILAGLVLLGDRRVIDLVGPCWRPLSPDGRLLLAGWVGGRSYAAIADWLTEWLLDCEANEFGGVAGTLGNMPSLEQYGGVVDVVRHFPCTEAPNGQVVMIRDQWTFEEYGQRLRPALLQVAADETAPRVMFYVLSVWGVTVDQRWLPGIEMAPVPVAPRPLLTGRNVRGLNDSRLVAAVTLEPNDFHAYEGEVLLSWAIFNPYGPTWSTIGVMGTEDPELDLLFFRMVNPFGQFQFGVAIVTRADRENADVLIGLVQKLFSLNTLKDGAQLLTEGGLPHLVIGHHKDEGKARQLENALLVCPAVHASHAARDLADYREFPGRPWEIAGKYRDALFKAFVAGEIIPPLQLDVASPTQRRDWLDVVASDDHRWPYLFAIPSAWHGAIVNAGPQVGAWEWRAMAANAFTFWELDDFLSRYGWPMFRALAEKLNPGAADDLDSRL